MSRSTTFNNNGSYSRPLTFQTSKTVCPEEKTLAKTFDTIRSGIATFGVANIQSLNVSDTVTIDGNLVVNAGTQTNIFLPNVSNGVMTTTSAELTTNDVKTNKVFIMSADLSLPTDPACDGTEIILYNNSDPGINLTITYVNGSAIIQPSHYNRFIYVDALTMWLGF
jgi:hypothetical protein